MAETHDVVVIGGGIVGCATALYMARAGLDVCLVDRGTVGAEASGRSAGGVRQNLRPPAELPLAMRSIQLWTAFAQEAEFDFEYRHQGNLRLAWGEGDAVFLRDVVARQQASGLECFYLSPEEAREMVPGVIGGHLGGAYVPTDGFAEPYLSCLAWAGAARRAGAVICERREVTGFQVSAGQVAAVETTAGPIATHVVVNAAGAWAHLLCRMVGVRVAAEVRRAHLIATEPLPRFLEPFLSCGSHGYFVQTLSGNVLSGWESRPVDHFDRRATYEALTGAARCAATFIPRLRQASAIRLFTGFTCWTPDRLPLFGPLSHPDGFYVAAQLNGTGFAMGPVLGELLTELVTTGGTSLPIEPFRPERFGLP